MIMMSGVRFPKKNSFVKIIIKLKARKTARKATRKTFRCFSIEEVFFLEKLKFQGFTKCKSTLGEFRTMPSMSEVIELKIP